MNLPWLIVSLLIALVLGLLCWVIPPQLIMLCLVGLCGLVALLCRPKLCFTLTVMSLPLVSVWYNYIHLQDVLIWLMLFSLLLKRLTSKTLSAVSLKTGLDWWLIPVGLWIIFKGITSADPPRGGLYAFRFGEAMLLYYMTVYMLRSGQTSLKWMFQAILIIGLGEAAVGTFQSLTGQGFWVEEGVFQERSYFAYLGLGSATIKPGFGTFWHFAAFGHYLLSCFTMVIPYLLYVVPQTRRWAAAGVALFFGIVFSYSRGALGACGMVLGYFSFIFPRKPHRVIAWFQRAAIAMVVLGILLLCFTDYAKTLNPRDEIWAVHQYYFEQHPESFWWGEGMEARYATFLNYLPRFLTTEHLRQFDPHNLALSFIHCIGVVGTVPYFAGLGFVLWQTWWQARLGFIKKSTTHPLLLPLKEGEDGLKANALHQVAWLSLNAGVHLFVLGMLLGGLNDHVFYEPYLVMWMLFLFAFLFACPWPQYAPLWKQAFETPSHTHV